MMEPLTVTTIEYHELADLIRKVYDFEDPKGTFSVVVMEEWTNDSSHLYNYEKDPLMKWQQADVDEFKSDPLRYRLYILGSILQDLVNSDHLPEGDLLITVCW